jgi:hypothetical protein
MSFFNKAIDFALKPDGNGYSKKVELKGYSPKPAGFQWVAVASSEMETKASPIPAALAPAAILKNKTPDLLTSALEGELSVIIIPKNHRNKTVFRIKTS